MKLLYIDSDEAFAGTLKRSLERGGVTVELHADGRSALEAARAQVPDAIVLSVELGDKLTGGYTWCQKIKKDEELRNVPLVLVSSQATPETFAQHRKLKTHADEYLKKPFDAATLLHTVGQHVALPTGSLDAVGDTIHGAAIPDLAELLEADEDLLKIDEAFDLLTTDAPEKTLVPEEGFEIALAEEVEPGAVIEVLGSPAPVSYDDLGPDELRAQLTTLEARLAAVERELAEKTAEVEAARVLGQRERNREYFQLKSEDNRKEEEILRLRENLNRAEREAHELRVSQTGLEERVANLEAEVARKDALSRTALSRAETASAAARRAEGTIAALRTEVARLEGEAKEAQERIEGLERELAGEQQRAASSAAEAERLGTELAAARAEATELRGNVSALEEELGGERDRAAGAEERARGLEAELATARKRIAGLETDLAAAGERAAGLETELTGERERAAAQATELVQAREHAAGLEAELAQARERGDGLAADLAKARDTVAELEARAEEAAAKHRDRVAELEEQVARGAEALRRAEETIEARTDAARRAREALSTALAALAGDA